MTDSKSPCREGCFDLSSCTGSSVLNRDCRGCSALNDAKDEVATGLHGNLIMQRMKLNSRVALVTGKP